MRILDRSRAGIAAQGLGIAQGATDYALEYAKTRETMGKPIAQHQLIAAKLADMETTCEAARGLLYRFGQMVDDGAPDAELTKASAMAKLYCTDVAMDVTTEAVQILGGYGYIKEYPVERMMRDAKITQIYEGTNEVQRLVIAREMLKEQRAFLLAGVCVERPTREATLGSRRDLVGQALPGEAATLRAAQEALDGERRGLRALWPFLGPAFIASVAYLDPGNFATDVAGGAKYGYLLLWAVLASNLMAMLVQTLSAKLGIATGRNLAEVCRDEFPRRVSFGLWLQAEVIAMATDLAEVLGAALGLSLLFGIPLGWGAVIAVAAAFLILALQATGFRRLEAVIAVFVGVIVTAFAFELLSVTPDPSVMADHLFSPEFSSGALLIAVGIVGATVMPHVIYLHSALTQNRDPRQERGRAEADPAVRAHRRDDRDVDRRARQPRDARDLRRPVLRHRRGLDRGRLPRPLRRPGEVGRVPARDRAPRLGPLVVLRRARSPGRS